MAYEHTQISRYVFPAYLASVVLFVLAVVVSSEISLLTATWIGAFLVIVGLTVLNFSSLTVSVELSQVQLRFGRGWPRKTIALADVVTVDTVRNKWWYGFGIRFTPHGWMYNVWGLDAVQLNYASGKTFRIGTDEPDLLAAALRAGLPARR